ncbi:hypothetical protein D3C85_1665470 [compost metagenome]
MAQPATFALVVFIIGHPEGQQTVGRLGQVLAQQTVFALLRPPPGRGDQAAEALVADQVFHQQHQPGPAFDAHFTADHQR